MITTRQTPVSTGRLNDLLGTLNFDPFRSVITSNTDSVTVTESKDDETLPDLVLPPRNELNEQISQSQVPSRSVITPVVKPPKDNSTDPPTITTVSDRSVVTPISAIIEVDNIVNSENSKTPIRISAENDSQPSTTTTPRSVLTDPDTNELETANTLLQLGNLDDNLDEIDKDLNNEQIMPVDNARVEDFTKTMAEEDTNRADQDSSDTNDSDKTVDYTIPDSTEKETGETTSPKGTVRYKHYGIRRHSPSVPTTIQRMKCIVCDLVLDSKKQLNHHHRVEHSDVTCPDCDKTFPTPDALQRHRYSHKPDHVYICDVCGKQCAFQSDLDRHKEKHEEERRWHCNEDECGRDFKRKAELVAHQVVHTGELFECEYPGCPYTNRDPRNVKRHYRVHTKEKRVKCKLCEQRFTFYQQMKRHMNDKH